MSTPLRMNWCLRADVAGIHEVSRSSSRMIRRPTVEKGVVEEVDDSKLILVGTSLDAAGAAAKGQGRRRASRTVERARRAWRMVVMDGKEGEPPFRSMCVERTNAH